jgi:hypothetical protein
MGALADYTGLHTVRLTPPPGAIAQLGERLDRTQEVASSSLASSISRKCLEMAGRRRRSVDNGACHLCADPVKDG